MSERRREREREGDGRVWRSDVVGKGDSVEAWRVVDVMPLLRSFLEPKFERSGFVSEVLASSSVALVSV